MEGLDGFETEEEKRNNSKAERESHKYNTETERFPTIFLFFWTNSLALLLNFLFLFPLKYFAPPDKIPYAISSLLDSTFESVYIILICYFLLNNTSFLLKSMFFVLTKIMIPHFFLIKLFNSWSNTFEIGDFTFFSVYTPLEFIKILILLGFVDINLRDASPQEYFEEIERSEKEHKKEEKKRIKSGKKRIITTTTTVFPKTTSTTAAASFLIDKSEDEKEDSDRHEKKQLIAADAKETSTGFSFFIKCKDSFLATQKLFFRILFWFFFYLPFHFVFSPILGCYSMILDKIFGKKKDKTSKNKYSRFIDEKEEDEERVPFFSKFLDPVRHVFVILKNERVAFALKKGFEIFAFFFLTGAAVWMLTFFCSMLKDICCFFTDICDISGFPFTEKQEKKGENLEKNDKKGEKEEKKKERTRKKVERLFKNIGADDNFF